MNDDDRRLTEVEGQRIAEFLGEYWNMNSEEEINEIRESMRGTVIRDYMSDGPGYFGPIYFIVFGGGPEFHFVLKNYKNQGFEIVEREFPAADEHPSTAERARDFDEVMGNTWCPKKCVKCRVILLDPQLAQEEDEMCFTCSEASHAHDPGCTGDPERCDCLPD